MVRLKIYRSAQLPEVIEAPMTPELLARFMPSGYATPEQHYEAWRLRCDILEAERVEALEREVTTYLGVPMWSLPGQSAAP